MLSNSKYEYNCTVLRVLILVVGVLARVLEYDYWGLGAECTVGPDCIVRYSEFQHWDTMYQVL